MKKKYILNFVLITFFFSSQLFAQVNVTFRVDMSSETVSTDGIHIVGSVNAWSTSDTQLTQEGTTNIYTATISLEAGWQEYKFLNGNAWGTEETAGSPCAPSNGNRFVYINDSGSDVILEVVPFNGCNADGTGLTAILNVDMSSETSISTDGVHLTGPFNGWNTSNFSLTNTSSNIYSTTLKLPTPADYSVIFEYKFINGNDFSTAETPLASCYSVKNTNRFVTLSSSGQVVNDVFNGCTPSSVAVTFNVDMTNETVASINDLQIAGSFNNWSPSSTFTKEASSDIYYTVVSIEPGWHEYKFVNAGTFETERNSACTPTNGNRFMYVNDAEIDVILATVPFNGCNLDGTGFTATFNVDMSSETSISTDGIHMTGPLNGWNASNLPVSDSSGNIYSKTLILPTPANYPVTFEYKYINGNDFAFIEVPDPNCPTVFPNIEATAFNRKITLSNSGQSVYDIYNGCTYTLSLDKNHFDDVTIFYVKNEGLKINTSANLGNLDIHIFDVSGREVKAINNNTQNSQLTINLNSLNTGIYVVKLENKGAISTKKIVINK